jgi:hypothetical protein
LLYRFRSPALLATVAPCSAAALAADPYPCRPIEDAQIEPQ